LEEGDGNRWRPLWAAYLDFYRATVPEETTLRTFERLTQGAGDMFALLAVTEGGEGVGIVHCVVHPTTWSTSPSCYLEDLFVTPAARGTNLGRRLIHEAKRASAERRAGRLYWHTQAYNGRARSLYDQVARPTSFIVYEM
jgi:GNAT superfamily N-acetyltransferase